MTLLYIKRKLPRERVAVELGVSTTTVGRWIKELGLIRPPSHRKIPMRVARLYIEEKLSVRKIVSRYGVSPKTVSRWLTHLGIKPNPRRYRLPVPKELKNLYVDQKMSQGKISKMFNVSQPQVGRWLRTSGIKSRSFHQSGPDHTRWKGGIRKVQGRFKIWKPEHPRADHGGYVFQHILIWEKKYGQIPEGYIVHHLNGIKDDDRIGNFKLMKKSEHSPWLTLQALQKHVRSLEKKIRSLGGKL